MITGNILVEHIHQQLYWGYRQRLHATKFISELIKKGTWQIKSRTIQATKKKSRIPVAHHQPDFDKRKTTATENEMLKEEKAI